MMMLSWCIKRLLSFTLDMTFGDIIQRGKKRYGGFRMVANNYTIFSC